MQTKHLTNQKISSKGNFPIPQLTPLALKTKHLQPTSKINYEKEK